MDIGLPSGPAATCGNRQLAALEPVSGASPAGAKATSRLRTLRDYSVVNLQTGIAFVVAVPVALVALNSS